MNLRRLFTREGERQFLVFLFCIGIALLLWLLHKLSMEYTTYFRYEVSVVSDMPGYATNSQTEETVLAKGKASGFYILKHQWGPVPQLSLYIPEKDIRPSGNRDGDFAIAASALSGPLIEELSGDLKLESLLRDSIYVSFTQVASKRCKIALQGNYSFDPQYSSFRPPALTPDSVTVTGPISILERIDSVLSQPVQLKALQKDMQGVVALLPIEGVHYSVKEVRYEIFVTRFISHSLTREIRVENLPAGTNVLVVPAKLSLQFWAPYDTPESLFKEYFDVVINYKDIAQSISGKLIPECRTLPDYVKNLSLDPPLVECIISKL